jgi:glycosyltransferase involved in cell wall biosynthesis
MGPRVTVILATYNWSSVLPYSIGSVLRQTFRDLELLVVGDGCTDDSEQVVAAIGDPRVRWINLPANTGHQSAPNNEGLRQARGEIIAYLGHDDLWLAHHLDAHVEAIDRSGDAIAYSLCMLVPAGGAAHWPWIPLPRQRSYSPPSCMTHRRSVTEELGGWRDYQNLDRTTPDAELWLRAEEAGRKFTPVRRLTAIKFPAAWRRDVYRQRPFHEQAHWLARIDAEPHLEAELLVDYLVRDEVPTAIAYRDLLGHVWRQTVGRLRRRLALPLLWHLRRRGIDEIRRFKGL